MKISRDEKRMGAETPDRRTNIKYKGTLMNEIFRFLKFKVSLINSGRPEPFDPFVLSLSKYERAQDRLVEGRLMQRADFPASSVRGELAEPCTEESI
jgi:hypothetical protein